MDILKVKNLSKKYLGKNFLENITFTVKKGEILAIVGENGSGKTTLLSVLLGLKQPSSGSFQWFDFQPNTVNYKKLGIVLEENHFFNNFNLLDNLKIFLGYKGFSLKPEKLEIFKMFGIEQKTFEKYKNLSYGQKRRFAFLVAAYTEPEVLIIDEPFKSLDPMGVIIIKNFLNELKKQKKTVIFSSPFLSEVEKLADKIIFLKNGKIILYEKMEKIKNSIAIMFQIANCQPNILNDIFKYPHLSNVYYTHRPDGALICLAFLSKNAENLDNFLSILNQTSSKITDFKVLKNLDEIFSNLVKIKDLSYFSEQSS